MGSALKKTRSFSLDESVLSEVERTKGPHSTSEHVNNLLKRALDDQQREKLAEETRLFFETAPDDREERRAFQKANRKTWKRE